MQDGTLFIDRDGRHFHDILNFLRVRFMKNFHEALHHHFASKAISTCRLSLPNCRMLLPSLLFVHGQHLQLTLHAVLSNDTSLMGNACRSCLSAMNASDITIVG